MTQGTSKLHVLTKYSSILTVVNPSELRLSQEEKAEIKDKGRWMRRVVNPFVDFYVIVTIGAAGSPMAVEATQRREDRQVRDHAKDL